VDEERRKQIEEEERYRAQLRSQFEREDAAERVRVAPLAREPEKPKRRGGGRLRTLGYILLGFVALMFISAILSPAVLDEETSS
jgi:hypothetical protein